MSRPFPPWHDAISPSSFDMPARDMAYVKIRDHADMVSHTFQNGVPWPEALNSSDFWNYPMSVSRRVVLTKVRDFTFVPNHARTSRCSQSTTYNGLASYWGSVSHQPLPAPWDTHRFNHPDVIRAFLITRSPPSSSSSRSFWPSARVEYPLAKRPDLWADYKEMHAAVYTGLKARFPELTVFVTIQNEHLLGLQGASAALRDITKDFYPDVLEREVERLLEHSDLMGLSVHAPHMAAGNVIDASYSTRQSASRTRSRAAGGGAEWLRPRTSKLMSLRSYRERGASSRPAGVSPSARRAPVPLRGELPLDRLRPELRQRPDGAGLGLHRPVAIGHDRQAKPRRLGRFQAPAAQRARRASTVSLTLDNPCMLGDNRGMWRFAVFLALLCCFVAAGPSLLLVSTLRVDAHDIGLLALFRTGTRIGVDPNPKASSNYERESKAESIRLMRSSTRVNHYHYAAAWADITERVQGVYTTDGLAFEIGETGPLRVAFVLRIVTAGSRNMPAAYAGLAWDSPQMIDRVSRLIEAIAPVVGRRPWSYAISSEIDTYFASRPHEIAAYARMLEQIKPRVQALHPGVRFTTSFQAEAASQLRTLCAPIVATLDSVSFYYPLTADYTVRSPSVVPHEPWPWLTSLRRCRSICRKSATRAQPCSVPRRRRKRNSCGWPSRRSGRSGRRVLGATYLFQADFPEWIVEWIAGAQRQQPCALP